MEGIDMIKSDTERRINELADSDRGRQTIIEANEAFRETIERFKKAKQLYRKIRYGEGE